MLKMLIKQRASRTTESSADTKLVRISCLVDVCGPWSSARELCLIPSQPSFRSCAISLNDQTSQNINNKTNATARILIVK